MEKLLKISFILSLLGILILIALSQQLEPRLYNIEDLSQKNLNLRVQIKGTMTSINNYDEFQTMLIKDNTGIISVISNSKTPLNKSSLEILIIGTVTEYQDRVQITADKIIELKN